MRLILVAIAPDAPSPDATHRRHAEAIASHLTLERERGLELHGLLSSPVPPAESIARLLADALQLEGFDSLGAFAASHDSEVDDLAATAERAWEVVEALKTDHPPDANLLLVLEAAVVRALVHQALAIPSDGGNRFEVTHGSLTTIEFRFQPQQRTILAALNETCHLEGLSGA